jgi:hypothetical protein
MTTIELRPLSAGEVLDRAITLFIRRFWFLVLILGVAAIPETILEHFISNPVNAALWSYILTPPGNPGEHQAILKEMTAHHTPALVSQIAVVLLLLVRPFGATACIVAANRAYRREAASLFDVYREALRRWLAQVLTASAFLVILIVVGLIGGLFGFVVMGTGLMTALPAATVPVGAILGAGALAVIIVSYFVYQLASVSIAIEKPAVSSALDHAFARALGAANIRRTLVAGIIVFCLTFGSNYAFAILAHGAYSITGSRALLIGIEISASIMAQALMVCYVVVYTYDVRIRREGYDITVAIEAGQSPA